MKAIIKPTLLKIILAFSLFVLFSLLHHFRYVSLGISTAVLSGMGTVPARGIMQ